MADDKQVDTDNTLPPPSLRTNLNDAFGGLLGAQRRQAKVETEAAVKGAQAEKEALAPIRQEMIQRQQAASSQMADIGKQMAAPVNLPHETLGDLAQLGSLIAIAAPMLGNAGKQSATVALNSLTGMMEGYRLGRNDLFNKAKQEYDLNIKRLTGMMTQVKTELDNYFKEAALKSESALADVNVLKAQLAGGVAASKLDTGGYQQAFQVAADIDKLNRQTQAANARLDKQLAAQKGTRQMYTSPDGKTYSVNPYTGETTEIQLPAGSVKSSTKPTGGASAGVGPTAFLQQTIGASSGKDKIDQSIVDTGQAIVASNELLEKLKDPDIKTGVRLSMENIKNRIMSIKDYNHEITDQEMQDMINGAVSPTEKNAIAKKEALFLAYQIEKEAQGGRLTVQMMRQGGQALDPEKVDKPAYIGIIGTRQKELKKRLNGWNLNDDQQNKLLTGISQGKKKLQESGATTQTATSDAYNSPEDVKAAVKANKLSRDEAMAILRDRFGYE